MQMSIEKDKKSAHPITVKNMSRPNEICFEPKIKSWLCLSPPVPSMENLSYFKPVYQESLHAGFFYSAAILFILTQTICMTTELSQPVNLFSKLNTCFGKCSQSPLVKIILTLLVEQQRQAHYLYNLHID